MNQAILDRAVRIATDAALAGKPIERLIWVPPSSSAISDPHGTFIVSRQPYRSTSSYSTDRGL